MLTSETKRRIDACRDVLVGKLPLPTDQVELITLALIYKFMDDLDEESVKMGGKRSFFIGAIAKYKWSGLLAQKISADERVRLFAEALEAMSDAKKAAHLPALFRDIFRNAFLKFRDGRILTMFLTEINAFSYSHSEELGNAFEYLLASMGTQGENGQFRTPRHIIDFMVECLDPQPGDRILDPACGTGGFLVSAYKHILATHTSKGSKLPGDTLTHAERKQVYKNLTGYDITDLMVKLSKVNLFLHGFPDPAIHIYDTLSNDARWNEKADVILANPPFMTPKGSVTPHAKFRIAAKKAEVLFTDYIAEHLTPDGRAAVIVPNGIVATTQNAYVKLRKFLVEDSLVAVVSLPAGVFKPYSGVKTSILFLDKGLARKSDKILFLKINNDGFDLGDKRGEIEANDLPEGVRVLKAWYKSLSVPNDLNELISRLAIDFGSRAELHSDKYCVLMSDRWKNESTDFGDSEFASLKTVVEKVSDTVDPKSVGDGMPCIGLEHIGQGTGTLYGIIPRNPSSLKSTKVRFVENDILYGKLRPNLNKVWLANFSGICSTDILVLRANSEKIEPRLLQVLMLSQKFNEQVLAFVRGAQLPRVSFEDLGSIEIPLPSLVEQRRIVEEIEGYQKVIDGARGVVEGWNLSIDVKPDWPMVPLDEVLSFVGSGITPRGGKSTYLKTGVLFIRSQNVLWGACDFSDAVYISEKTHQEMVRTEVKQGDVLFNITGASIGRSAVYQLADRANVNQHVTILRPKKNLLPVYLSRYLLSSTMQNQIQSAQTGASREALNYQQIKELEISLPSIEEQRAIVAELDAEAAQIEVVRGLIPKFEGKIARVLGRVWGEGK